MKKIYTLLLAFACMLPSFAAGRMRDVFASMPDSVLGLMTKNNRLDCIDFIENNMEAKVRNRLDGYSVLKAMTDDYLDLQLTPSCRVEMKLLPLTDTLSCICMVRTYASPVPESEVSLYTSDWQPLPTGGKVDKPLYEAFWKTGAAADAAETARLQHLQDMHYVSATLSADDHTLTFALQPGEVDKETAGQMAELLRPVVYVWRGGRFTF